MKIRWSSRARLDLIEIGDYIARDNPSAALDWILELEEKAKQAAEHPQAGRVVPELEREDVREVFLKSYRIVYQMVQDHIEIVQVFEGHRLLRPTSLKEVPPVAKPSKAETTLAKKKRKR